MPMWAWFQWSSLRLQLMILLSALLASLTGLMVGERPVAPAQVELSAAASVAQAGEAVVVAIARPTQVPLAIPAPDARIDAAQPSLAPVTGGRAHLHIKQSWLI